MNQCPSCFIDNPDDEDFCLACATPLKTAHTKTLDLPTDTVLLNGKDRYKILNKIDRGGFGITYRAVNQTTSEVIVIKERFPDKGGRKGTKVQWGIKYIGQKQEAIKEFKDEAQVLAKCKHESIVRYHDCFEENDTCYIVMDFIKGKSVRKLIDEQKKLPELQIRRYFLQLAEALQEIHNQKTLHRDIKPENIMIESVGDRAILIDFGAAREFEESITEDHTQLLTASYAPIEQYGRRQKRTASADIYSLCASMYHAISGCVPPTAMDRFLSQKDKNINLLQPLSQLGASITHELEEIILMGMEMEVKQRFLNADQLIEYLKGNPVTRNHIEARKLAKDGNLDQAIKLYEDVLLSKKDNFKALIELAQILVHQNRLDEAKVNAEKALQQKPNDRDANGVLGLVFCRKGEWQKAIQSLERAVGNQTQRAWILINFAWSLGKVDNWQRASHILEDAFKLSETQTNHEYRAFATGLRAWIYANTGNWKQAIPNSIIAISTSEQSNFKNAQELQYWVYPCQALAIDKHPNLGSQHPQMLQCLNKFSTLLPNNSFVEGFKGWQMIASGATDAALPFFQQAAAKSNVSHWIWMNLAILYEQSKIIPNAIQTYENYLKAFKDDPIALFQLGRLLGDRQNWERACEMFDKVVNLQPNRAEAFHNKGWALLNLLKAGYSINGKDQNTIYKDMVDAYSKAVSLYRNQNHSAIADQIQQSLPFIQ
jgi:eukaryotic-like serine/threonine-protein kinase